MKETGPKNPSANLSVLGLKNLDTVYWNLTSAELTEHTILVGQGVLNDTGALVVDTGEFTGRSPKDKFIVKDSGTENSVNWGGFNIPIEPKYFDQLLNKMTDYLQGKKLYARDAFACAHPEYKMSLRVITELPWSNMFADNMFISPTLDEISTIEPEWNVLCVPSFKAEATVDGTRQHNFSIVNFTKKMIIIGGSGYTGEIKKGIFTVLNYVLPHEKGVLPMHCSANEGKEGDVAVFFGLSGTGKTTLSADANRYLIGDDEHGWSKDAIFNFEGG
jgi:phosphoenolpyruvate carboxykinase (ATP)